MMAASQTDVFFDAPSIKELEKYVLNEYESIIINGLIHLKSKKKGTSTGNIFEVCQKACDLDKTLFDGVINNLIMTGKVERKIHCGKTTHRLLCDVSVVPTPIEESIVITKDLENSVLEEVIEVIQDPIMLNYCEFESFVGRAEFLQLKNQVEKLLEENNDTVIKESEKLKKEICFLKDELKSKNTIIGILQQTVNSFEREKSKLSNNIKQISKSNNKDEFVIPKRFNKAKQLPTTNGNIKMSNRFNELIVNNDDDDFELVNEKSNNHIGIIKNVINSQGEAKPNHRDTKKRKTVIIGDSMVKEIKAWKLKKRLKENVQVKSFPGATIDDMKHYVIPTKKEEPNIIILHAGTNNLRDNQSTTSLANNIIEFGISLCTPQNEVVISGICHRADVSDKKFVMLTIN